LEKTGIPGRVFQKILKEEKFPGPQIKKSIRLFGLKKHANESLSDFHEFLLADRSIDLARTYGSFRQGCVNRPADLRYLDGFLGGLDGDAEYRAFARGGGSPEGGPPYLAGDQGATGAETLIDIALADGSQMRMRGVSQDAAGIVATFMGRR
jgi:hypothetical protein